MKRENRFSLQRQMLFVVQGMLSMLLCFSTLGCKTPTHRAATSAVAKRALPLTVAPSPTPTPQNKSVPASQPATSPAVVAKAASRPVQEPLRPGQKDQYGRELLFTFRSLVDGAPISEARVYGDDRPRIIHLHLQDYRNKLFFLNEKLQIQSRREVVRRQILPAPNGRAVLLAPGFFAARDRSLLPELVDDTGRTRWKTGFPCAPYPGGKMCIAVEPVKIIVAEGWKRTLLVHGGRHNGILLLLNEKGQDVARHVGLVGTRIFHVEANNDSQEIVYAQEEYDEKLKQGISRVVRARLNDLRPRWNQRFVGRAMSLAVARRHTAVVVWAEPKDFLQQGSSFLYLLDQRGKIKWKKQVANNNRVAFWPNESRVAIYGQGTRLLETTSGREIARPGYIYPRGFLVSGRMIFGSCGDGFTVVDTEGQVHFSTCRPTTDAGVTRGFWFYQRKFLFYTPTGLYRYRSTHLESLLLQQDNAP